MHVEACALTLTNGEQLQEPIVRKNVKHLQGKNWKGKSPAPRADSKNAGRQPRCSVPSCSNVVNVSRKTGKPFKFCKEHDSSSPDSSRPFKKRGREEANVAEASSESIMLEDAQGNKSEHVLDARTIEVVKLVKDGTMKVTADQESCKQTLAGLAEYG